MAKIQSAAAATLITLLAAVVCAHAANPAAKAGPLRGGEAAGSIAIDLRGQKCLVLRTEGYSWGQSVWGEATLVYADGRRKPVSSLKPQQAMVGWGRLTFDKGNDNKPLQIAGRTLKHGIFAHADSMLVYELKECPVRFESLVGINHTAADRGRVTFTAKALPVPFEFYVSWGKMKRELAEERLDAFGKSLESMKRRNPEKAVFYTECMKTTAALRDRVADLRARVSVQDPAAMKEVGEFLKLRRTAITSLLELPLLFVKRNPYYAGHI